MAGRPTLCLLIAAALWAAPAHAKSKEGVTMADSIDVAGKRLVLNGLGVREATILNVKVYVAGLYLEEKSSDPKAILSADKLKRLVMTFKREVEKDDLVEAYAEGFEKVLGEEGVKSLAPRIKAFNAAMRDIKEGQRIVITYEPGAGTTVEVGGKAVPAIAGLDFASAIFGVYLGADPPNKSLKSGLLGKD